MKEGKSGKGNQGAEETITKEDERMKENEKIKEKRKVGEKLEKVEEKKNRKGRGEKWSRREEE